MLKLREYQQKIIHGLRCSLKKGNKRLIMCAPTGSGKTVMFTYMVSEHLKRGGKVLIISHRLELINQTDSTISKFNLNPELITAGSKTDFEKNLHIAMIETIYKRVANYSDFINSRTMIIMDEAHLTPFNKIFPFISEKTVCIGATATPLRTGKQECLSLFYTDLIQEVDTYQLIQSGYLCNVRSYGVEIETKGLKKIGEDYDTKQYYEQNKTYKGVVENYIRLVPGKKTIVFASNVESSKQVCQEFNLNGIPAKHIDGTTQANERLEILNCFKNNKHAVLCNCGILTAGYDEPTIEVVILYRATSSLPLYLQMVGRGSRRNEGKEMFYLLDFGNNVRRFDLWESPRIWSLNKATKKDKLGASPIKQCKKCGALLGAKLDRCEYCGNAFPVSKKYSEEEIAKLVLLPKKDLIMQSNMAEKVKLVNSKVVKASHVLHSLTQREEAEEFCRLMGYKRGFIKVNEERYAVFRK